VRSRQRAVPRSVTPLPIPATFRPSATGGQATEAVSRHQPVIEQRTGHGNAAGPARSCVVTCRFDAARTINSLDVWRLARDCGQGWLGGDPS
jgi:hypothetical protein